MSGSLLRWVGTTATFAPVIKRAVATLSTGRTISLFIDTNIPGSAGSDLTGVAKIFLYLSNDTSRTSFTQPVAYTPPVAPASTTRYAVASITVSADDSIWVAWQGVDNALYVSKWSYNTGTHAVTFVSTATVVAAGAVVNRFRVIDIDCATNNPMIATYEANASDGNAAFLRLYALKSDNVTWIRSHNITALGTGKFIRAGSEDVSIAVRGDGVVSNVVRAAVYCTKTYTTGDEGDFMGETSFNISSGAADSGTRPGTWGSSLNKANASGTRKGMLFTLNSTIWLFAGAYGTSSPRFFATKITTGVWTAPVYNYVGYVATVALSNYFRIDNSYNARTAWTATYKDNKLSFAFASLGPAGTPRIAREIVISWTSIGAGASKATIDSVPRPLDSNRYNAGNGGGGPIGLYGGDNRRVASNLKTYNYMVVYGPSGNTVSTVWDRELYFVAEDTFEAPILLSPSTSATEASNSPTYRVRVDNLNLTPNLYGKIEIQVAADSAFTTSIKSIIQPDSAFQYFGSKDGLTNNSKTVTVPTSTISQRLITGTWYWRARIISDKDSPGAWASYSSFTVSHPPSALPISPAPNAIVANTAGATYFTWKFSDTDPNDSQSEFRVRVTDSAASVVLDSGWTVSSAKQYGNVFASSFNEIPYTWTVQLKDADSVAGPESNPIAFTLGYTPTVDITSPLDASTVTTAAPTIAWNYSSSGARTQRAYRVIITAGSGPLSGSVVADTAWVTSSTPSHAFTSNVLETGVTYDIDVSVLDTANLLGNDAVEVVTDWIEPALGDIVVTKDKFKVHIAWTDANKDAEWVAWRVYRRYMKTATLEMDLDFTAQSWVLLHETQDDLTAYEFDDYTTPLNRPVDYVVVQLAERFGSILESNITAYTTVTMVSDRYFFVPETPVGSIASFEAADIVGDGFTRDVEQETVHVKGRGKQMQIGDDLGYVGSLQIHLRNPATARMNREFLERLSYMNNSVWIKSPFGDVILVGLGVIQTTRLAGFGSGDIVDLTVPYTEVITPDETIRLG
jgi:hypothetical protein